MRFDTQVIYPHPVLRPDVEDYRDGEFQTVVEYVTDESQQMVEISASYDLSVAELVDYIENGTAGVGLLIDCRDTFFRRVYPLRAKDRTTVKIEGGNLHGKITVTPIIYALEDIDNFASYDFDEIFHGLTFDLKAGDLLAHDENMQFFLEREAFEPVESIITLTKDKELTDYEWQITLDEDQIEIRTSETLSDAIQLGRNSHRDLLTLINSIYFSAVQFAIENLKTDPDTDKKWANVIRQKCLTKSLGDIDKDDTHVLTQRLLEHPIKSLAELFVKED